MSQKSKISASWSLCSHGDRWHFVQDCNRCAVKSSARETWAYCANNMNGNIYIWSHPTIYVLLVTADGEKKLIHFKDHHICLLNETLSLINESSAQILHRYLTSVWIKPFEYFTVDLKADFIHVEWMNHLKPLSRGGLWRSPTNYQ